MKFTPELAYVIGMWHASKSRKGIGVCGEHAPVFAQEVLRLGLPPEGKLVSEGSCIFFYHHRWKKYFLQILDDRLHRFKFFNEYSASYFAGIFDASARLEEGKLLIFADKTDEFLLNNLNFYTFRRGRMVEILQKTPFFAFIRAYVKFRRDLLFL
jgi:hypothetical protein